MMTTREIREWADRARAVPLLAVLDRLGAERDRHDRAKWHTEKGPLSVTGAKFMNWRLGVGGGGAIDLVIHLEDLSFIPALEWLSRHFPGSGYAGATQPSTRQPPRRRQLHLPSQDAAKLSRATRYLVQERRLPPPVVYPLVKAKAIYADERGNAVFLMLDAHTRPVGAELRGTTSRPWRGMAPGSCKDLGYFSATSPQPAGIVLCESAIDALSCHALRPELSCISTAGARPNPRWLAHLVRAGHGVSCGFDADTAGDEAAHRMIARYPTITRLRPPLHDWNDVLKSRS
ncbi:MAG: DUF3991 and TOPRIM domain-containing protein [Pseudomonadota bacterium]